MNQRHSFFEQYSAYLHAYPHAGRTAHRRLHRVQALLAALGHPERSYQRIQIIGTNGKGSTAAMLQSVLTAAGYRTGLFTSPHLVSPSERIRINTRDITIQELEQRLMRLSRLVDIVEQRLRDRPTWFEVVTALATQYFLEQKVDVAIFESGLGGRFDATTALRCPIKIITSVSYDHLRVLGPSLEAIATDKASAIERGDQVVTTNRSTILRTITEVAQQRRAKLWQFIRPADIQVDWQGTNFTWCNFRDLHTNLIGPHQAENAVAALAALQPLEHSGIIVPERAIRIGLQRVHWPGRFEILARRPAIVFDGAHNPEKIRSLVRTLDALKIGQSHTVAIFACLTGKNAPAMLRLLGPRCQKVFFPQTTLNNFSTPEKLLSLWPKGRIVKTPAVALHEARRLAGRQGVVIVTGSLYFIGQLMAEQTFSKQ